MLLLSLVCIVVRSANSSVFNARLKVCSDGNDVIAGGSMFQILALTLFSDYFKFSSRGELSNSICYLGCHKSIEIRSDLHTSCKYRPNVAWSVYDWGKVECC